MHRVIRTIPTITYGLGVFLALPSRLAAQTPAAPRSPLDGIAAFGVIVGLLVVIGICVKLYDIKRKHDEQGLHIQVRVSDALLNDPELAPLPLAATVRVPFRRPAAAIVTVTGRVPTSHLREAAVRTVLDKIFVTWPSAHIENRIVVEPHSVRDAAA